MATANESRPVHGRPVVWTTLLWARGGTPRMPLHLEYRSQFNRLRITRMAINWTSWTSWTRVDLGRDGVGTSLRALAQLVKVRLALDKRVTGGRPGRKCSAERISTTGRIICEEMEMKMCPSLRLRLRLRRNEIQCNSACCCFPFRATCAPVRLCPSVCARPRPCAPLMGS